VQEITPFLCFDNNAEEAMNFYASIFNNSKIGSFSRYPGAAPGPVGMAASRRQSARSNSPEPAKRGD
jgi:predicted 3-demethylubiquinone-9 3-methyltransferase (glyoxalase superfamily)